MKKLGIFLLCFLGTAGAVYITGFPYLVNDFSESLAVTLFFGCSLLLSVFVFAIALMGLKIKRLGDRINELEKILGDK